jgi:hypothetical protein
MKAFIFVVAVAAANLPAQAASLPDPIAPAASGQLQCFSPDTTRKTCNSLAGYTPGANGTIDNTSVVLLSKNPVVTMETVAPVEIKASMVCGTVSKQDVDTAKFRVGGRLLDAKQAEPLRAQVMQSYMNVLGHEVCAAFLNQGGILLSKGTIDGVPMPATTDQRVLWVSPGDGYTVSP